MLISTEYNYIYRSIVTEIDKFMLNLLNLSITSSTEFNNFFFFFAIVKQKGQNRKRRNKR